MEFADLEREILLLCRSNNFAAAYAQLQAYLDAVTADDGAAKSEVLFLLALTYYSDGPRHLPRALGITEDILPGLTGSPVMMAKTLINGLVYASLAGDSYRLNRWRRHMEQLLAKHAVDVGGWYGRCVTNLGRAACQVGDKALGRHYFGRAIRFYAQHQGPYDERDRLTLLGLSHGDMAECLMQESPDEGRRYLDQGWQFIPTNGYSEMLTYIEALWNHVTGQHQKVPALLEDAYERAIAHRDHRTHARIVELWAHHSIATGNSSGVVSALDSLIREMAAGRMIQSLQRLQELRAQIPMKDR